LESTTDNINVIGDYQEFKFSPTKSATLDDELIIYMPVNWDSLDKKK
jgi:hypothetical protein